MQPRFEQFIRERQYLTNVSPATLEWYKHSFKWLPSESPTEQELKDAVIRMKNFTRALIVFTPGPLFDRVAAFRLQLIHLRDLTYSAIAVAWSSVSPLMPLL